MAVAVHRFSDRAEAGRILAEALSGFGGRIDTLILALPRGGVPVAYEVSKALKEPLDLWLVRKLGVPGHEELAMGALAANGAFVLNEEVVGVLSINQEMIDAAIEREKAELERRNSVYRQGKALPNVAGKTVIVIDDGLATGATMKVAIKSLRGAGATWIVAAAPVGSLSTCEDLKKYADEVICPFTPEPFYGVGMWYEDFLQTSDREVRHLLAGGEEHAELRP